MKRTIRRVTAALLLGLMLLSTLGWAPSPAGIKMVEVATVDELVAAVEPNATLELLPGTYVLSAAATYGRDTGNPCCRWVPTAENGYELQITGADGLTLRGAGMDETTLLARDQYATVLTVADSKNVTVASLTAGHSPMPGVCSGGVLHFASCNDVNVEGCGLFGCGTIGVRTTNCTNASVAHSRIYECSEMAVYADNCWNVQVQDCEIDHNGRQSEDGLLSLFQAYEGDGFHVSGCHVHDNSAAILLECEYIRNVSFLSNRVDYNTLQSAFMIYGTPATVDGCAFHGNAMAGWYGESYYGETSSAVLDAAGRELTESDLDAMGLRDIDPNEVTTVPLREPTQVPPGGEITVTSADEFLAAIGPDRTILVEGDGFSLADAADYGGVGGRYYRWEMCYDGPQLVIMGANGLAIRGSRADGTVTLTAVPRYANVLGFNFCEKVTVSNLTLGHTEGPSDCSGDVLDFESCTEVALDHCRLYGCGTLGVNAWYCEDLHLTDCEIYDCSLGGVVLGGVREAIFENCRIHDVPSPALSLYGCDRVLWNNGDVPGEHYDVSESGQLSPVALG